MTRLADRVVLITGCSTGIGRALAEECLERGFRTVATARDPSTLEDLRGDRCLTASLDVTDRDHVDAIEQRAGMSKNLSMPAADFARRVLDAVARPNPPAVLKVGGGARLVPMVARLPKKVLAAMLGRRFGLDRRWRQATFRR
jgi:NAD(P)-dependent dehydrogenase (short-subunit alcohol dehydrogenase family)